MKYLKYWRDPHRKYLKYWGCFSFFKIFEISRVSSYDLFIYINYWEAPYMKCLKYWEDPKYLKYENAQWGGSAQRVQNYSSSIWIIWAHICCISDKWQGFRSLSTLRLIFVHSLMHQTREKCEPLKEPDSGKKWVCSLMMGRQVDGQHDTRHQRHHWHLANPCRIRHLSLSCGLCYRVVFLNIKYSNIFVLLPSCLLLSQEKWILTSLVDSPEHFNLPCQPERRVLERKM